MGFLDLAALPLWAHAALFAASAALIWTAGTRLSGYAEQIAVRTGVSRAFLGAAMLGGITSLPELTTTVTASALGNASLSVNNLIGGVAMQVVVLTAADFVLRRRALSSIAGPPVILLQGCLVILMLCLIAAGVLIGEPARLPVGPFAAAVTLLGLGGFAYLHRRPGRPEDRAEQRPEQDGPALAGLYWKVAGAAAAVLVGGVVAAQAADQLAARTPLGSGLLGFFFLSASTSLPEVSTVLAAARLNRPGMAFSNIFGSNVFDLSFLALADAVYGGAPVLNGLGRFSVFGCLLGIALTGLYLAGLIERRDRQIGRWGPDSLAVIVLYAAGAVVLVRLQ